MIVELPNTTTSKISKALVKIREEGGAVALGRVLTLVIATELGAEEESIAAANDASREHPMRVIVVSTLSGDAKSTRSSDAESTNVEPRLDAEIRVGGDAGASEVVVLRAHGDAALDQESLVMGLLLPDAPVAAWWPGLAPSVVGESPLGRIALRRITDASTQSSPQDWIQQLGECYRPGDTDFAWTRLTLWRAQLAAVLDQPPYERITAVEVSGAADSPSTTLLAAWLQMQLRVPVSYELRTDPDAHGIHGVRLTRASGDIVLARDSPDNSARLTQPGAPVQDLALKRRSLRDCLADELRRLEPDELYGNVITHGLAHLGEPTTLPRGVQTQGANS